MKTYTIQKETALNEKVELVVADKSEPKYKKHLFDMTFSDSGRIIVKEEF